MWQKHVFDAYEGVDGTALSAHNSAWVLTDGGFELDTGGVLVPNDVSTSAAYYQTGQLPANTQYVDMVVGANPSGSGTMGGALRLQTADFSGYTCMWGGTANQIFVYRYDNGSGTELTAFAQDVNAGTRIRFEAVGDVLTVYADGVQVWTGTDSTYPSGYVGVAGFSNNVSTSIALWEGGWWVSTSVIGPAVLRRPWTKQPPIGTRIDWTNPLAAGLKYFLVATPHGFYDAVSGTLYSENISSGGAGGLFIPWRGGWAYKNNFSEWFRCDTPSGTIDLEAAGATMLVVCELDVVRSYGSSFEAYSDWAIYYNSGQNAFDTYCQNDYGNNPMIPYTLNVPCVQGVAMSQRGGTTIYHDRFGMQNNTTFWEGQATSDEAATNYEVETAGLMFGTDNESEARTIEGWYSAGAVWSRAIITPAQQRQLAENPWQVFKPKTIYIGKPKDRRVVVF